MDFGHLYDFENEFQFQLYKDICREPVPSTHDVTQACDLNHMAAIEGQEKRNQTAQQSHRPGSTCH
jgi:hypothetical protein